MPVLPQFQDDDHTLKLMQNRWASILDPLLNRPGNQSILITDVVLATGDNVINHLLGRKLRGWIVILKSANVDIYDKQSTNQMTDKTLVLNSSGAATISLEVF